MSVHAGAWQRQRTSVRLGRALSLWMQHQRTARMWGLALQEHLLSLRRPWNRQLPMHPAAFSQRRPSRPPARCRCKEMLTPQWCPWGR